MDEAAALKEYASRLLASFPDLSARSEEGKLEKMLAEAATSSTLGDVETELQQGGSWGGGGELTGCREAVEILTRNMRKGENHHG